MQQASDVIHVVVNTEASLDQLSHARTGPQIGVEAARQRALQKQRLQAAKDPVGRELLESLLMDFALRNETGKDEITRVDISKLRRGLGMEGA